jgi:NADPH:quinone reductase-like Zn-dependent oxidoreductase
VRAAVFHEFGGPEQVRIEDAPRPEAAAGTVVVRVVAAALNHLDVWVRRGLPIETTMPHIGGSDVAGVIDEVGAGIDGFRTGDPVLVDPSIGCGACDACRSGETPLCSRYRILGEHTQGGFAEYVAVPAENLYALPAAFDLVRAAAAPLAFLTAWRGLIGRGRLRAGETVLVTGASGGVATAAVQIARLAGARVFAVTTAEHVDAVRGLGADTVYDRTAVDWSKEVWRDTEKRGVDLIFDSVGAATWPSVVRAAARAGRIVVYGATTGPHGDTDLRQVFWKQIDVLGTTMSGRAEFRTVMDLFVAGALAPVVDVVWPLERAADAHARLEAGRQFGKIVLTL